MAILERGAEAQVKPRNHAERPGVARGKRNAVTHERHRAHAEVEAGTLERVDAVADHGSAERTKTRTRRAHADAARRAAGAHHRGAATELERMLTAANAEVAGGDRKSHERRARARRLTTRAHASAERHVAE